MPKGTSLKLYWERHNAEKRERILLSRIEELEAVIERHKRLLRSQGRMIVNFEEGTWLF